MPVNKSVSGGIEQVCAYYTAKVTFFQHFPVKVYAHIIQVSILYSNFCGI